MKTERDPGSGKVRCASRSSDSNEQTNFGYRSEDDPPWTRKGLERYHEQLAGVVRALMGQVYQSLVPQEIGERGPRGKEGEERIRDFLETIIEPAYRAISSRQPIRFTQRSGKRRIEYHIDPRIGPDGQVDEVKVEKRDVPDRKLIEKTVRRFHDQYRFFLVRASLGVGLSDMEGHLLLANPRILQMIGYSLSELKSLRITSLCDQDPQWKTMTENLRKRGKVRHYEVRIRRKDGSTCSLLLNIDPIDFPGERLLFATAYEISSHNPSP